MTKEEHKERLLQILEETGEIKIKDVMPSRGELTITPDLNPAWEALLEIQQERGHA